MAAVIKAVNAKIRSNPVSDYLCSTRTFFHDSPIIPEHRARKTMSEVFLLGRSNPPNYPSTTQNISVQILQLL